MFQKQRAKKNLIKAFHSGEIYRKIELGKNSRYLYPTIHDVDVREDRTQYVFTLLNGMDPKKIRMKEYCFKQAFGKNIVIEGDLKKFVLNVYNKDPLPKNVKYNYADTLETIKGSKLPIVTGINSKGKLTFFDMLEHPHMLVAGETGSGKSSLVRVILSTLIQYKTPDKLHLYLADLKMGEFHLYKNVEHVKHPVCNNAKQVANMLKIIKTELKERGKLLDLYEVGHIDETPVKKPYIVLCIDEFALLKKETDIMDTIEEISSIGRALGVFLVLSCLRPDREVMEGKLKNNLTVRIGMKCADYINAKIIGTVGAEKLEHPGRLLLKLNGLQEIQSPLLTQDKAKKILSRYKKIIEVEVEEVEEEILGRLGNGNET